MYDIAKYEEAYTVEEAIALLLGNPRAIIIAGGSDVLIKLHAGRMPGVELVSIHGIPELTGIKREEDGTIAIGSGTSFTQIARDPIIRRHLPVLGEAAAMVGGPQVRNIGTIGGNVCNGVTSADSASTLVALNAKLRIQGLAGERVVSIHEFYKGAGKVALAQGDIVTAILITRENYAGFSGHYIKYAMRSATDIAVLGCVAVGKFNKNRVVDLRLALGVAGPTPLRCAKTDAMMTRRIAFTVNGQEHMLEVDVRESLLEVLRRRLALTGVKRGCSVGECGACTVLIDGEPFATCIYLAVWVDGKEIRTIEGEAGAGKLCTAEKVLDKSGKEYECWGKCHQ